MTGERPRSEQSDKPDKPFEFDGVKYASYDEVIQAGLKMKGDKQKAFVRAFCMTDVYARQNIGYWAAYYDREMTEQIFKVFETAHPIFGTAKLAPEDAFKLGQMLGEAVKRGRHG